MSAGKLKTIYTVCDINFRTFTQQSQTLLAT